MDIVQALLQNMQQGNERMTQGAELLNQNMQLAQELIQSGSKDQAEAVAQQSLAAGQKANIEYKQNQLLEGMQSLFGMTPGDANNEVARSLAEADLAKAEYRTARAEYDEVAGTSILDNPIGYIIGQLRMPSLAARVNSAADKEENAIKNIQTRAATLQAVKSSSMAHSADQIKELSLQAAEADTMMAQAKLKMQQGQNIVAMNAGLMQQIQVANQIADNERQTLTSIESIQTSRTQRAIMNEERAANRALRQQQWEINEAQKLLQMEALETRMKDKKNAEAEEAALNQRLATVSQSLGRAPITVDNLKTLPQNERLRWLEASQTMRFGDSLWDSLKFYNERGSKPNITAQGGASIVSTADKMLSAGGKYEGLASTQLRNANQGKTPKREEAVELGFKMYQEEAANAMGNPKSPIDLSNSKWDSTYNPYVADMTSFNKIIDQNPQLAFMKNNSMKKAVDEVVGLRQDKFGALTSEEQNAVLGKLIAQVHNRQMTAAKAAAEISAYMNAETTFRYKLNKYDLFGMAPQKNYLYTVPGSSAPRDNAQKVDLLDAKTIENMIQKKMQSAALLNRPLVPFLNRPAAMPWE